MSLLAVVLVGVLSSCEFRETIVFNKDASGVVTTSFYGEQMGELMESFTEEASAETVRFTIQDLLDENPEDFEKLSKEEKENILALADTEILIEQTDGNFLISMDMPFKSLKEVNSVIKQSRKVLNKNLSKIEEEENTDSNEAALVDLLDISFRWENQEFERKTSITDEEKFADLIKLTKESSMDIGEDIFSYVLKYTFPYQIESVIPEIAEISKDRKTLTIRQPVARVTKNPKLLDFKIKFKK